MTMNCDSLTDNLNTPSFIVELLSIILNDLFEGFCSLSYKTYSF